MTRTTEADRLSQILPRLAEGEEARISLGDIVTRLDSRAHTTLLVLFALLGNTPEFGPWRPIVCFYSGGDSGRGRGGDGFGSGGGGDGSHGGAFGSGVNNFCTVSWRRWCWKWRRRWRW